MVPMSAYEPGAEHGPIRALLGPAMILVVGGAAAWAYVALQAAPAPALPPVNAEMPSVAPAARPATIDPEGAAAPAAPDVAAMRDVEVACPLAPGVAPSGTSVSAGWYDGSLGFSQAEREQSLNKAPMLVYLFTDWCPYCKSFEREVLEDRDVDRYLRGRLIKVRVNPEQGPGESAVERQLQSRGYPSIYLLLPGAEPLEVSSTLGRDRQYEPPDFVRGVEGHIRQRADSRIHEAATRRQGGDPAGAIEVLDEAIALAPDRARAYYERGLAYEQRGDLSRAFEDFGILLTLEPRAELYGQAGEWLGTGGRHDEAAACWTQWLLLQPGNPRALLGRSRSHQARGDLPRARADADEACRRGEPQACHVAGSL